MSRARQTPPNVRERLDADRVRAGIAAMTDRLLQKFNLADGTLALVGVQTRGVVIATRIAQAIKEKKGVEIPEGAIDITLYRDDFSTAGVQPVAGETHLDFDIDGKDLVLIDDVLYTGRTVRAALDEIMDFGRPRSVTLYVLIDRGHRELPIAADFAAITVKTDRHDKVILHLLESDAAEEILICEPEN